MKIFCAICLEEYDQHSNISVGKCGHPFHTSCLESCFGDAIFINCPQCRSFMVKTQIVRLYFNVKEDVKVQESKVVQTIDNSSIVDENLKRQLLNFCQETLKLSSECQTLLDEQTLNLEILKKRFEKVLNE